MPLSNDDIHEILRIIDETPLDELTIETEGFSLHVRKGEVDAGAPVPHVNAAQHPDARPPSPGV